MVGLSALWMPIILSAVFVFIALSVMHMLPGWHKGDMTAVPGEAKVMETLRGLNVPPGDYRFPFSNSVDEMKTPEWDAKMTQGPVGTMTIQPNGPINFGKLMGQWFVYSLFIAVLAAYVTGRTRGLGAPHLEVFRVSGAVTFCCYVVALWQDWIWWGKGTRATLTNSVDGIIYALITGATFGWLWPR
jgi:hypothetical protein